MGSNLYHHTERHTGSDLSSVFAVLRVIELERMRDNEKSHVVVAIGSDEFPNEKQKQESKVQMWVWNENAAKVAVLKWQLEKMDGQRNKSFKILQQRVLE